MQGRGTQIKQGKHISRLSFMVVRNSLKLLIHVLCLA